MGVQPRDVSGPGPVSGVPTPGSLILSALTVYSELCRRIGVCFEDLGTWVVLENTLFLLPTSQQSHHIHRMPMDLPTRSRHTITRSFLAPVVVAVSQELV